MNTIATHIHHGLFGDEVPEAYSYAFQILSESTPDWEKLVSLLGRLWSYIEVAKIVKTAVLLRFMSIEQCLAKLSEALCIRIDGHTRTSHYLPGVLLGLFQAAVEFDRQPLYPNPLTHKLPEVVVSAVSAATSMGPETCLKSSWGEYQNELGPLVRAFMLVSMFGAGQSPPSRGMMSFREEKEKDIQRWRKERVQGFWEKIPHIQTVVGGSPAVLENFVVKSVIDEIQYAIFAAVGTAERFKLLSRLL